MRAIAKSLLAGALAVGLSSTMVVQDAQAHRRGHGVPLGIAAGIIGLGVLGAYASRPAYGYYRSGCYKGPEQCGWTGRRCWENRWGETVCRGGEWRCWRRTYCD